MKLARFWLCHKMSPPFGSTVMVSVEGEGAALNAP
jgi:hypothetical protein